MAALPAQQNLVQHVTPLGWEHISLTGDYIWAGDGARPAFTGAGANQLAAELHETEFSAWSE